MMKKNTEKTKKMKGMFLWALPLLFVSCSSFQGVSYYGDGIYGEELPEEVITYVQQENDPIHYKSYFNEMAQKANNTVKDYTSFTDVDSYQTATNHPSYAGWGQNTSKDNVTINVYDNFNNSWGYDPYYNWNYGSNYYWGMGAWSPYYRSSWGYYGPRNRISFGFGWGSGWNYPYYSYGYGYNPYYGYIPYYGYYDPFYYGGYYPYYGNRVYRNSNNYAYVKGIRRGGGNYKNTSNDNSRRSYRRTSNNSYNNHQRRSESAYTRSYSRNSTGGYTPAQRSSSSYTPSSTERRTYQRNTSSSPVRTSPSSGYSRSYSRNSNTSGYRGARRGD